MQYGFLGVRVRRCAREAAIFLSRSARGPDASTSASSGYVSDGASMSTRSTPSAPLASPASGPGAALHASESNP
eukprot:8971126-Pyramimonas_sp.AAC.2